MNINDEMVWEDPPANAAKKRESRIAAFIAQLDANPGRWARWGQNYKGSTLKYLMARDYPNHEWTYARAEDGTYSIYGRRPA